MPLLLTCLVLTVFPLYDQEKERSQHQQELSKALESLGREKMELEMRLREQQTETEVLRTQRQEERAEAESALCQVRGWEDWSCMSNLWSPYLLPLPFPFPGAVLQWLLEENVATHFATSERVISTISCRAGNMSYFLREG